jgi:hypothetical protein
MRVIAHDGPAAMEEDSKRQSQADSRQQPQVMGRRGARCEDLVRAFDIDPPISGGWRSGKMRGSPERQLWRWALLTPRMAPMAGKEAPSRRSARASASRWLGIVCALFSIALLLTAAALHEPADAGNQVAHPQRHSGFRSAFPATSRQATGANSSLESAARRRGRFADQTAFRRRRRASATSPPQAAIRPGSPAPTMGPGVGRASPVSKIAPYSPWQPNSERRPCLHLGKQRCRIPSAKYRRLCSLVGIRSG